jgi:formylglycine-generating enzyme required for sulfatase activity/cytochrome c551/c552
MMLVMISTATAAEVIKKPVDSRRKLIVQVTACLACHGVEGMKSDPTFHVPKIEQQHADYLLTALRAYKNGTRKSPYMQPQMALLVDKDLQALAEYFGADDDAPSPGAVGAGAGTRAMPTTHPTQWKAGCGACHGQTGLGDMPGYPVLTGQYEDYLVHAMNDYRNGNRQHPFMSIYARTLNDADIKEIASYLATQRSAMSVGTALADRAVKTISMVDIPAGEFLMGTSDETEFNFGKPEHWVSIRAFRLGKYSVTFDQYDAFALDTGRDLPGDEGWGRGSRPVINVTLQDTLDFIAWLNKKTGKHYRLPSESEREYAARAGTSTQFSWGDSVDPEYVNGKGVQGRDQWKYTAPVGQFRPNAFGLYDMAGNVAERTADCWHSRYDGAPNDGRAWVDAKCHDRVVRGSYWGIPRIGHATRTRVIGADAYSGSGMGFRLAEGP